MEESSVPGHRVENGRLAHGIDSRQLVRRLLRSTTMNDSKLRAWWWHRQGLDGSLRGKRPGEVLERSGWARSFSPDSPKSRVPRLEALRRMR